MGGMNAPHAQPLREDPTELDLKILDVLREAAQSARLLAETISQSDEQVEYERLGRWSSSASQIASARLAIATACP